MNMNDYRQALDKVTPRNELKDEIISQCAAKPRITHSFSKRKLAPILAAAAVLATGTVGVAAATNADWFGSLFEKENVVVTEESSKLIADFENFNYQSDKGISISPVGMIANENTLYCVLNLENCPSDISPRDIQILNFDSNTLQNSDERTDGSKPYNTGFDQKYDAVQKTLICQITANYKLFSNGDNVTLTLGTVELETLEDTPVATLNFDINFGDMKNIEIDFDNAEISTEFTEEFKLKNMKITPLNIIVFGNNFFEASFRWRDMEITMNDGTVIIAYCQGGSATGSSPLDNASGTWKMEEPINPENIKIVFVNGEHITNGETEKICLYTTQ